MDLLNFNIYGYCIEISSTDYPLRDLKVCSDFRFFAVKDAGHPKLQIKIKKLETFTLRGIAIGKTSMCQVRQVSVSHRQLVYRKDDQTLALVNDSSDSNLRKIEINAANAAIIDDVLYFIVNSCSGEYLDYKGLMRIHALSFSSPNRGGVVYGFPGAGKSTVAVGLLQNESVRIFSDEISILDINNQMLLPFPIRLAVAEISDKTGLATKFNYFFNTKYLISLDNEKIAQRCGLTHFHFLDNSKKPIFYYLLSIVLGIGLIQMWEYLVRFNNLPTLLRIAFNRFRLCRLLCASRFGYLDRNLSLEEKLKALL